jgi:hypothetical protein
LDGAYGPYILLMCLLICGLVDDRKSILLSTYNKKSSLGKVLERITQGQGLFRDGTSVDDLKSFIDGVFSKMLSIEVLGISGVEVRISLQGISIGI